MRRAFATGALIVLAALATGVRSDAAGFQLTSPSFTDGGTLSTDYAGPGPCGGKDLSPPLAWSGAPPATKSFAVIVTDLDGRNGLGVVHWVAYGIQPETKALPTGFGSQTSSPFIGGPNNRNLPTFLGLCPPVGDVPHHYVFTVYALDLAPGALPAGLTRDALLAAMGGHALAASVIVGRFGR